MGILGARCLTMINRAQNEPEARKTPNEHNAEDENVQSRVLCKMCKAEYNVKTDEEERAHKFAHPLLSL